MQLDGLIYDDRSAFFSVMVVSFLAFPCLCVSVRKIQVMVQCNTYFDMRGYYRFCK